MQSTTPQVKRRSLLERPDTQARWYAAVAGVFLLALGILSLIITARGFGTVGSVADQPQFIIWAVSGWLSIFWIVMGALGLMALARAGAARNYALGAGIVFAVVAIWGFIDGNSVFGIFAADTTDNITHAILAAWGLLAGLLPYGARSAQASIATDSAGRFSARQTTSDRTGHTAGQR
jgi:FtsH-binding integral membrane protein